MPRSGWRRWHASDRIANQAHHVIGVIVELYRISMCLCKRARTAYLDIEQDPNIFQSGLRKILKQLRKTRHLLMGFLQRSQLAYELIVAVYNLLVPAKTSLQVPVL